MAAAPAVDAGTFTTGMAYVATGDGEPLVVLAGLTADHALPTGAQRSMILREVTPLAAGRRVWWVNRRAGLVPGTTMADLAAEHAAVLREAFPTPVDVVGASTGGVLALQLAADHPDVVRRLVLRASACRLSDAGRAGQARVAALARTGRRRRAWAVLGTMLPARAWARPFMAALSALGGGPRDPSDMLVTIAAEDATDLEPRLAGIRVPTLVVGGDRDRFYGELIGRTAELLPDARLVVLRGQGHLGAFSGRRAAAAIREFLAQPVA